MNRLVIAAALAGCSGVPADPGLDADLRVAGAQFFLGEMPTATADVQVSSLESPRNTVRPGQINKALSGRITHDGRAVALALADDAGYWVVPAGAMDVNVPDDFTWSTRVSFAPTLADGTRELDVAAIDGAGRFGPPEALRLTVQPHEVELTDTKLVVSLSWDTEADLDLHVVVPSEPPITVWSKHQTSYIPPPFGEPVDPTAIDAAGILDVDSNGQCLIDGRREENVVWRGVAAAPPAGTYAVLIDTFSLCAAQAAHWTVDVYRDGAPTSIAHAEGIVVDSDTRGDHVASSGVRAVTFSY
jgi:uncharacterized protein YfaP (DUF2135 family)